MLLFITWLALEAVEVKFQFVARVFRAVVFESLRHQAGVRCRRCRRRRFHSVRSWGVPGWSAAFVLRWGRSPFPSMFAGNRLRRRRSGEPPSTSTPFRSVSISSSAAIAWTISIRCATFSEEHGTSGVLLVLLLLLLLLLLVFLPSWRFGVVV